MSIVASKADIVVLDYESTGSLRGYPDQPWQIGMVMIGQGQVDPESMFESLIRVDPNRPFNPHAPGRHDQLRAEISAAPAIPELWSRIRRSLTPYPLCAHNAATEKRFTRSMAPMHRFGPWIDTLSLARKAWPGCSSYALADLMIQLELKQRVDRLCPGREAHDALYDAVAAAVLLTHLFELPGWGDVSIEELALL